MNNGIAFLGANPSDYGHVRIKHSSVCPAVTHEDLDPAMEDLVRILAQRSKKLRDAGFVPSPPPRHAAEVEEPEPESAQEAGGIRHIIVYGDAYRICPGPLDELQCVASNGDHRCTHLVLDVSEGSWEHVEAPHIPGRAGQFTLDAISGMHWVWVVTGGSGNNPLRWLRQRCPSHDSWDQENACPIELISFHPVRHGEFMIADRPRGYNSPAPSNSLYAGLSENLDRRRCATEGCWNATVLPMGEGWLCWQCEKRDKRRSRTHSKWTQG